MNSRIKLEPHATSTINLMRYNGYSLVLAIADIVDNSLPLSVKAKNVYINIVGDNLESLYVTIQDDGSGMDYEELKNAMHLSDKDLNSDRSKDDLGKFGLGLKSASFSQCADLVVLSKKNNGPIYGMQWDLNYVADYNDWSVNVLKDDLISSIQEKYSIPNREQGTVVLWRSCSYLLGGVTDDTKAQEYIASLIVDLQKKLSLIYHKYISRGLKLHINGVQLEAMDPFCINGPDGARSTVPFQETILLDGHEVKITGYLLPHSSKIGGKKREDRVSLDGDLMANQGLYFYRVDRLISWGSWHNLIKKSEANKLARVDISVGNNLDYMWDIEIKKSTFTIPYKLREQIKYLMNTVASKSNRVGTRRVEQPSKPFALWKRVLNKDTKSLQYSVDEDHPILLDFINNNNIDREIVSSLVKLIGSTFPVEDLKNDISQTTYKIGMVEDDVENRMLREAMDFKDLKVKFENYYATMLENNVDGLEPEKLEKILSLIKKEWFKA
jgi:hypothetical protein